MMAWGDLPQWATRSMLSIVAIALSYAGGHLLKWIVGQRLGVLTARTRGRWDDVVVAEFARRIPYWGLLLGGYLAMGLWTLPRTAEDALTKTLFVLIAVSLTLFSSAIVTRLMSVYGPTLQHALPVTSLTSNIATGTVITIGLLIVLNGLGVSITPILTALGVGGLAVALALQDTLANLFAGIYVTIAGQIRVGDYVRLDSGQEGYIADIGWRSTRIRMLPNNMVLVPNAKLGQAIVTNFYLPDREMAVLVQVGVDYGSDLAHVERVTCEVARETLQGVAGGAVAFDPFIRFHTFADSSINFTVILRVQEYADQYLIKHEFIKRLHHRYGVEGITIPFPIRTLVRRDGEEPPAPRE